MPSVYSSILSESSCFSRSRAALGRQVAGTLSETSRDSLTGINRKPFVLGRGAANSRCAAQIRSYSYLLVYPRRVRLLTRKHVNLAEAKAQLSIIRTDLV